MDNYVDLLDDIKSNWGPGEEEQLKLWMKRERECYISHYGNFLQKTIVKIQRWLRK